MFKALSVNSLMWFHVSDKLKRFFASMVKAEEEIVRSVELAVGDMKNFAVKSVLRGISYDSLKHAELYRSASELLSEVRPTLDEGQLDVQKDLVARHIAMEEQVILRLEEMIPGVENKKVLFILNTIIEDERRHHRVLKRVEELLVKGETVTEEDWWDAAFGDVPGLWG
jgi:ABC-type phosphate transport system ATPase subunit